MLHVAHGVGESTLISAILVDLLQIFDAPTSLIHGLVNTIASLKSLATRETVKLFAVYNFFLNTIVFGSAFLLFHGHNFLQSSRFSSFKG